ncbi:hypothetical protein TH25_01630 [Thalassospira profundimaris]|uniref:Uncharacterized protein n=1 Tax=Thalassospira profundimaris TaxID=502049 RepID=A0A367XLM5_9PROT|nr:hypothetical protein TH25_01630 [Thalassospira profundimaris]
MQDTADIIKHNNTTFFDPIFVFSRGIAISYLNEAMLPIVDVTAVNNANIPNALGSNSLLIIGVDIKFIACANAAPIETRAIF